jgi:hypothetical protein
MGAFAELLQRLGRLLGDWFDLPDVDNEQEVRACVEDILQALKLIARRTKPTWDDKALASTEILINTPIVWNLIYELLKRYLGTTDPVIISETDPAVLEGARVTGFGPLEVLAIVRAIIEILRKLNILSK